MPPASLVRRRRIWGDELDAHSLSAAFLDLQRSHLVELSSCRTFSVSFGSVCSLLKPSLLPGTPESIRRRGYV